MAAGSRRMRTSPSSASSEARIQHLARHDALTDLPNRIAVPRGDGRAPKPALSARRKGRGALHRPRPLQGGQRHARAMPSATRCCKQASARLWGTTRETDVLARLGGDEFALLLRPIDKRRRRGARSPSASSSPWPRPFIIDGHQIVIGASVGIAIGAAATAMTTDTLMKNADLALYRAKSEGRSTYPLLRAGMDAAMQQRRSIEAGLRLALAAQRIAPGVPAAARAQGKPHHLPRGAAALGPCRARHHLAGRVHPRSPRKPA